MDNPQIDIHGTESWKNGWGNYHRLDGPAVTERGGRMRWYYNGKLHREDGPAIEFKHWDDKHWFIKGVHIYEIVDGVCLRFEKIPVSLKMSIAIERLKINE
jgi:hypothetical protein